MTETTHTSSEDHGKEWEQASKPINARSRIAYITAFPPTVESDSVQEWFESLPYYRSLDNHEVISKSDEVAWLEARPEPIDWSPNTTHRTGTCFEVESTEMRESCVEPLTEYLNADAVLHEVRHQRSGYHTDLVLADIDPEGLHKRKFTTVGTDPLHDPLQRFRVWWYMTEEGPMTRKEAEEDGRYMKKSLNEKGIDLSHMTGPSNSSVNFPSLKSSNLKSSVGVGVGNTRSTDYSANQLLSKTH